MKYQLVIKIPEESLIMNEEYMKFFEDKKQFGEIMKQINEIKNLEQLFDFIKVNLNSRSSDFQYLVY